MESNDPVVGGLLERFLPHFLHELGNLHLTVRGNVELRMEDGVEDAILGRALDGLERAGRLAEGLRMVLRPQPAGEPWDLEEATDATLALLEAATRDGAVELSRLPAAPLPPCEGDRRGFCGALLLLGIAAADDARSGSVPDEEVRPVTIELTASADGSAVEARIQGLAPASETIRHASGLLRAAGGSLLSGGDPLVLRLER